MLMIYQLIAIILGILAIVLSILRFRDGKMSLGMMFLWIIIWLMVIFVAIDPNSTNFLAVYSGIGRGLDFVLIIGLLLCFYLIFKMYNKIESVEEELTDLVRELALTRKIGEDKEKQDKTKYKTKSYSDQRSK